MLTFRRVVSSSLRQKVLHNLPVKMSEAEERGVLTYCVLSDQIVRAIIMDGSPQGRQAALGLDARSQQGQRIEHCPMGQEPAEQGVWSK